jgi:hypothetical protein
MLSNKGIGFPDVLGLSCFDDVDVIDHLLTFDPFYFLSFDDAAPDRARARSQNSFLDPRDCIPSLR